MSRTAFAMLMLLAAATAETATYVLRPEGPAWVTPTGAVEPRTAERVISGEKLRMLLTNMGVQVGPPGDERR